MKKTALYLIIFSMSTLFSIENENQWRSMLEPYSAKLTDLMMNNKFEETIDLYDENVVLIRPLMPPLRGKKALREELREMRRLGFHYHAIGGETEEIWGCNAQILERGTLSFSYSIQKQAKPQAFYGSFLTIWKQQKDGTYKIEYSIWNLDFNPWE